MSKSNIPKSTIDRKEAAKKNINRTGGQREFHGNANTPIKVGASEHSVLDHLAGHAGKNTQLGQQSKDLLDHLGGVQGGADPKNHITLSTGHHLRFNNKNDLQEITGPEVRESKGRQGPKEPSETEKRHKEMADTHELDVTEPPKVDRYMREQGMTLNQAVTQV